MPSLADTLHVLRLHVIEAVKVSNVRLVLLNETLDHFHTLRGIAATQQNHLTLDEVPMLVLRVVVTKALVHELLERLPSSLLDCLW